MCDYKLASAPSRRASYGEDIAPAFVPSRAARTGVATYRDITDEEPLVRRLERANEHLKSSISDLQHLSYGAAHDLKEPLATVQRNAEHIAAQSLAEPNGQVDEHVQSILDSCERMKGLVNHLLSVAHFTSAPLRLEWTPGDILVWMAVSQLQAQINGDNARVTHDLLPKVLADQTQVARVLQNLISNAIKYRHPDRSPEIHISCNEFDDELQLEVRDNGCGIPDGQRERIFEPYRSLHGNEVPGSGLGLWICRQIIERHGGRIWVESKPGEGSVFRFSLKRMAQADAA